MDDLRKLLRATGAMNVPERYAATAILVGVIAAIRWALSPYLGNYPYFVFLGVVTLAALLFESGCGVFAALLSGFVVIYFFTEPYFSLSMPDPRDVVSLFVFLATAIFIAVIAEAMRRLADQLNDAEDERTELLAELRHRTRNNLHIVGMTVALEASLATTAEARQSLERVAERLAGVARIGDLLHRADAHGLYNARDYLERLIADMSAALADTTPMDITCDAEPVTINRDDAEVLGIAANELITNAIKYAYPDGRKGAVAVMLRRRPDGGVDLSVTDDGVGIPPGGTMGSGIALIRAIISRRKGGIDISDNQPGHRVVVHLPAPG